MALLSETTLTRGLRTSNLEISQGKPLSIGDKIWMYERNRNQGLRWALRTGATVPVDRVIYGHLERVPNPEWVEYGGADETSQGTTGLVLKTGHGARVTTGSRIYWPRIKEVIRLDAAMSTDTTGAVTRNYGRGNASTSLLKIGDKGLLLTPNFQEGFTVGSGITSALVYKSFAVEEMDFPVALSNKESAEKSYAGDPFARALGDAIRQSKNQMEATMYLSGQRNSTISGVPITASEGIDNFVQTNVYSASYVTRMDLWDIITEMKARSPEGFSIHCSNAFINMVSGWGMDRVVYSQDTKVDGVNITGLRTPMGEFQLLPIDLFNQEPYLMGTVFFVPNGKIQRRPLIGNGENFTVGYMPIKIDDVMSKRGHIYGIEGWEFFEQETWGKLDGLQFAA
jgi:hypothetical protein